MKQYRIFRGIALLLAALAAILSSGGSALAAELGFTMREIRDPQMNNAVAARVAVPQGWVLKEQQVPWNLNIFGDPARVFYILQGPADEVEFTAVSGIAYSYDQSTIAIQEDVAAMLLQQQDQLCRMSGNPQLCAQINAEKQKVTQQLQQFQVAYNSGKEVVAGVIARPPMWAADIAQELLREDTTIADLRITGIERPAELVALLQKAVTDLDERVRQIAAQFAQANMICQGLSFDVARLRYTYAKGGKRYEGVILAVTRYLTFIHGNRMQSFSPNGADPVYGKQSVSWRVYATRASALAGRLQAHEAELTAIAANSAVDPVWQTAVEKVSEKLSADWHELTMEQQKREMAHQQKMHKMRMDTFNYVNKTRQEVFARRSESLSRVNAGWTDAITSRQVWQSGDGEKVVIPDKYDYAWRGSDGKIIGSNNSNFDPNISSNHSGNWERMQKSTR